MRYLGLSSLILATLAACGGTLEPLPGNDDGSDLGDDSGDAPAADAAPGGTDAALPGTDAAPGEMLSVSFDTTPNGGPFAPTNVVAVWIEGPGGVFARTIGRWSAVRTIHLVAWGDAAGDGDVDAVAGATRPNHTQRLTVTWDMTDRQGVALPDGTYTIRMELADQNSAQAAQNHQGTFTFDKNGTAATQNVAGGGFTNVTIDYSGRP